MTANEFFDQLDARIAKYDLLCHPFYKAWSAGTLTSEDLQIYGRDYFHHVAAFPVYLQEFGARAEDDQLRRAVEVNREDELGMDGARPHPELWLDFVEGMGGDRNASQHEPVAEITQLMESFHSVAREGSPEQALAAFYAYESQVPRVAAEKAREEQNADALRVREVASGKEAHVEERSAAGAPGERGDDHDAGVRRIEVEAEARCLELARQ